MATEKQIEANKQNSILGGVKTDEGKKISRENAIKHGFFSHIVTKHDKLANEELCDEAYDLFDPYNIYEAQLVEIMLSNLLTYRRICIVESTLITNELNKSIFRPEDILTDFSVNDTYYQKFFRENISDELLKFQRYKTSALNLITKTQHELERLIRIRNGEPSPLPSVCDINISAK